MERLSGLLDDLDETDPPDTPVGSRRTPGQRRHDTFARLVAAEELPGLGSRHGLTPRALFTIDLLTVIWPRRVRVTRAPPGVGHRGAPPLVRTRL